ncbi:hypothetical protein [Stygiolobus azoricus]|uniref:Uncharacterized protein n=1 Tax=Stygiolobus azoricus TaxID=41675 RepID=A0A650CQ10_9CREN|nr:hypothetical protein [Stygiolobus azoricus]QGR19795.1 hypothetical protein D1868_07230 [Stygiolobus azoricus]
MIESNKNQSESYVIMRNGLCFEVKREITEKPTLIMLNRKLFRKITENEIYLKVLSYSDFKVAGVSKSYYYYALEKLKEINLIRDRKINFKLVVSYFYDNKDKLIKIDPAFIFIGKNYMCIFDSRRRCNMEYELLAELGIEDGRNTNLYEKVKNALFNMINKYLTTGVINVI